MSREESVDLDLLSGETYVYGGFNGSQQPLADVADGYTIGYTDLGRKGTSCDVRRKQEKKTLGRCPSARNTTSTRGQVCEAKAKGRSSKTAEGFGPG